MACRPLELLADMQVKDWNQTIITYSTTINLCEEGVPMACSPLELLAKMHGKDCSQLVISYSTTISPHEKGSQRHYLAEMQGQVLEHSLRPHCSAGKSIAARDPWSEMSPSEMKGLYQNIFSLNEPVFW